MRANPCHSWPIVNNFFRANNEIVVAFFRAWAYTLCNMKNEMQQNEMQQQHGHAYNSKIILKNGISGRRMSATNLEAWKGIFWLETEQGELVKFTNKDIQEVR